MNDPFLIVRRASADSSNLIAFIAATFIAIWLAHSSFWPASRDSQSEPYAGAK
jgi:hypothetical protein